MELTEPERALLLRGLFELTMTHDEDDMLQADAKWLAEKLGGSPDAPFFGANTD